MNKRPIRSITAAIWGVWILTVPGSIHAEQVEHPTYTNWARFPEGTRVTLRATTTSKGDSIVTFTTTTLIRKDEKAVVISKKFGPEPSKNDNTEDGVETAVKRFFPVLPGVDASKIGKPQGDMGHGAEKVEILGKTYQADWYESRASTEAGPATTRTWISMDMPGQILKSVTEVKAVGKKTVEEVVAIEIPGS